MSSHLYLLCIFVIIWQPTLCFFNFCHTSQNEILNTEECSDLYFEATEKTTSLGRVKLELEQNTFKVTPEASTWTSTFLKISMQNNASNQFCSKLQNEGNFSFYCFTFIREMENETFLLEYRIHKLPEISSRRFVFTLPNKEMPLFLFIDQTDLSRLILKAQKLPTFLNVSYYKVEAYKEKNGNTNLQDMRLFSFDDEIRYELFTYNDVGNYYFVVSVLSDDFANNNTLKISTPKVFIGRKGTRVVIGIVGASFILPFILFIFHILTKKYPSDENGRKSEERLMLAYKSSSKKHNEVVHTFAALLQKLNKNLVVDIIDLSKPPKKFSRFCVDSLLIATRIVYVAPPKNDLNPILIEKTLSQKEMYAVIFEYCDANLPQYFDINRTFKLFEQFDNFLRALNISGSSNCSLYRDLVKKTEVAKIETEQCLPLDVPKIIVTESEPEEHDSLISAKVVL